MRILSDMSEMVKKNKWTAPQYQPINHDHLEKSRYIKTGENTYQKLGDGSVATITCVGDMLCEEKMYWAHCDGDTAYFHDVFQFVRPIFRKSDLVIGNLETCICNDAPYTGEQFKIEGRYHNNAPLAFLDAIEKAGMDLMVMANNHNLDCGLQGVTETLEHVERAGLMHVGLFRLKEKKHHIIVEVNGIKLAVLAYSTWYNHLEHHLNDKDREKIISEYSEKGVKEEIAAARRDGAEFVLVYMHWGVDAEYKSVPSDSMKKMAQKVADSGADYIIGSHPHCLQPYALISAADGRQVPCIYSMGNFITSEVAKVSRETGIFQITLAKQDGIVRLVKENFIPCYVPDSFCGIGYPVVPTGYPTLDEGTKELIEKGHANGQRVVGECNGVKQGTTMLTTWEICRILGQQPQFADETYTRVNFARDTAEGSVAVISEITSDPTYRTQDKQLDVLADLAIQKGAKLLISARQIKDYPCIVVDDVFDAYCKLIKEVRARFTPRTVAITGSIGKTTATEMAYTVLSSKFNTHRNTGSANSVRYAGTVIQQLKPEHEFYVQENMEGPPYGAASTIAKLVQPQAAIVTVVGTSHLAVFGSQERIMESCLGVQDGMPKDGVMILNADDPFQWNAQCSRKAIYYGIDNEKADYRAVNIRGVNGSLRFDLCYDKKKIPVCLHCFGKHNVLDALAAFAAGKWAGMSDQEIVSALDKYRTSGIRQNLVTYGGYKLFLDCYNAAPESVESALDAMSMIERPKGGRYIGVLADIKEVGNQAEAIHRRVGKMAAASCLDMLICYGTDARLIAEEAKKTQRLPVYYTNDVNELRSLLKTHVTRNDVVLFKGSHSMELEHVVDLVWGTWFHEEFERYDFKTHVTQDKNLRYRVYTDHATVVNKISNVEDVVIPDVVDGVPVTGIAGSAFANSSYTKSVKFPENLVNVRYCAFYKANAIHEIHLPRSVRIIYRSAFNGCDSLTHVTIDEGCTHIGYRAFGNCKNLESIVIPSSVKQIGSEAFLHCRKLKIYGKSGSYAETYAKNCRIPFVKMKENTNGESLPCVADDACCVLMDAASGEILFEQNGNTPALIASLSKIMVAYQLIKSIESGRANWHWDDLYTLGDEVTFKNLGGTTINANSTVKGWTTQMVPSEKRREKVSLPKYLYRTIRRMKKGNKSPKLAQSRQIRVTHYMEPGDKLSLRSLLYGAMTVSGNDAAAAIAAALEGTEEQFVKKLNTQMHSAPFNLSDSTYFSRAYGRDCYSSALDVAKMLKVILDDPDTAEKFWEFAGATETDGKVSIIHTDGTKEDISRENTHPFINGKYKDYLTNEIGENYRICGKTGTWIVDFVLATVVEREGRTLISTVLKTKNEKERDDATLQLLSWGFQQPDQKS